MKLKHSVFLSSTHTGFKDERAAIIILLIENDCIPICMEFFAAQNQSVKLTIEQGINESDIFLLIIGDSYGDCPNGDNLSYVEIEYNYAKQTGKKIIPLIYNDPTTKESPTDQRLEAFKAKVKQDYIVQFCKDLKILHHCIEASLKVAKEKLSNGSERKKGWVKIGDGDIKKGFTVISDLMKNEIIWNLKSDNIIHTVIIENVNAMINVLEKLKVRDRIEIPTHILYGQIIKIIEKKQYKEFYIVDHAIFRWNELLDDSDKIAYNTFDYSKLIMEHVLDRKKAENDFSLKRLFLVSKKNLKEEKHLKKFKNIVNNIYCYSGENDIKVANKIYLIPEKPEKKWEFHLNKLKRWQDLVLVRDNDRFILFVEEIDYDIDPNSNAVQTKSYIEILSEEEAMERMEVFNDLFDDSDNINDIA